jgi:hypothetical protein
MLESQDRKVKPDKINMANITHSVKSGIAESAERLSKPQGPHQQTLTSFTPGI